MFLLLNLRNVTRRDRGFEGRLGEKCAGVVFVVCRCVFLNIICPAKAKQNMPAPQEFLLRLKANREFQICCFENPRSPRVNQKIC